MFNRKQRELDRLNELIDRVASELDVWDIWGNNERSLRRHLDHLKQNRKDQLEEKRIRRIVETALIHQGFAKGPKVPVDSCETGAYNESPSYKD